MRTESADAGKTNTVAIFPDFAVEWIPDEIFTKHLSQF